MIFSPALQDGPLVLEPGPVFAKDGDKNRSEQISYRILRGLNRTTTFKIAKLVSKADSAVSTIFKSFSTKTIVRPLCCLGVDAEDKLVLLTYCSCWTPLTPVPPSGFSQFGCQCYNHTDTVLKLRGTNVFFSWQETKGTFSRLMRTQETSV